MRYIHIGQDTIIADSDLIGIFDIDNTTQSHITRKYLNNAEALGQVENIAEDIPRSFVVCSGGGNDKIYLSQLSSATLLRRSENPRLD